MNKSYGFLMSMLLASSLLFCDERMLSSEKIVEKSVAIKQMMKRHTYAANMLIVLGSIQALSVFVPMLIGVVKALTSQSPKKSTIDTPMLDEIKPERVPFFTALSSTTKDIFYTKEGWKTFIWPFIGQMTTSFMLQKIDKAFFHPDSLKWYISVNAPYVRTVALMNDLIKKLTMNSGNESAVRHYHDSLVFGALQLVGYGEDICAYMVYKSGELEGSEKEAAERISRYLFNYQNEILGAIFTQLDKASPDYNAISKLMATYNEGVKFQLKLFNGITSDPELVLEKKVA